VSDGTTLLFGLPGVRVERVECSADGTRVVYVVTAEETAAACPVCGVVSGSVKGRVWTSPRDIPYGQHRIIMRWNKTRWRCREDHCGRGSFTESIPQVPCRARTTGRLRIQIGAAVGDAARAVSEVAAAHAVSWPTAHRAFVAHAAAELAEPQPTPVLGIDETRRGKPNQPVVGCGPQQSVRDASTLKTEFVCGTPQRLDGRIRVHDDSAAGGDSEPDGRSLQQMNRTRQPRPLASLVVRVDDRGYELEHIQQLNRGGFRCLDDSIASELDRAG
jgi:hypothetical protein